MFNQNVLSIALWRRRLILDLARPLPVLHSAPVISRYLYEKFVAFHQFLRDGTDTDTDILPTTRQYILIRVAHYSPRNIINSSR